jgi:hypothetical protein
VLGEDVPKVQFGDSFGRDCCGARDEEPELSETLDDYQNGIVAVGFGKFFDEVHGDRLEGSVWDRKLLEKAVRLVPNRLGPGTTGTSFAEFGDIPSHRRPIEFPSNEIQGFDEAGVSSCRMVVFILHDAKTKISFVGDVDTIVVEEKSRGRDRIWAFGFPKKSSSSWISGEGSKDVRS